MPQDETASPTLFPPPEFRDEQQYRNVCNMLERWGRLRFRPGAIIMDSSQGAMNAFLGWLTLRKQYGVGKCPPYRDLRKWLDEPTVGMLFDLIAAMGTGHDAIDAWMGNYGPEIFG
jgi:hypothetical protein